VSQADLLNAMHAKDDIMSSTIYRGVLYLELF
jgi:hypothetical protein